MTAMENTWTRLPCPVADEQDRRALCAILAANGLEVRIVRERPTPKATFKKYVEYRAQQETD